MAAMPRAGPGGSPGVRVSPVDVVAQAIALAQSGIGSGVGGT